MKQERKCLRCGAAMQSLGRTWIALGDCGRFSGPPDCRTVGTFAVEVMKCPGCRKLEFFEWDDAEDGFSETPACLPAMGTEDARDWEPRPSPKGGYRAAACGPE